MAAAPTAVLSSLALKGVLESSQSAFEQVVGRIDLRFDATQAILERLAQGARADLLILTSDALEDLRRKGEVTQVRALGSSGVGLAVRAGRRGPTSARPKRWCTRCSPRIRWRIRKWARAGSIFPSCSSASASPAS
jgi:hypothetical protein